MKEITRKKLFKDLIKGLFHSSNVKFFTDEKGKGSKISKDGNQVSEAKYNAAAFQKFRKIICAAFEGVEIINSSNSKPENAKPMKYEELVENSYAFFKSLGFEIDKHHQESVPKEVRGKLFCGAITEHLLPFIFDGTDPESNAESDYKQVFAKLEPYFAGFDLGYIVHKYAKASDLEEIFDSEYKDYIQNDECNKADDKYSVLIDTAKEQNQVVKMFPMVSICLGLRNDSKEDEDSFNSIIGPYQKYPFSDDEPFINPLVYQIERHNDSSPTYTKDSYFPLSPVRIKYPFFIQRYFYYITRINESIISEYNSRIKNEIEMDLSYLKYPPTVSIEEKVDDEYKLKRLNHERLDEYLKKRAVLDYKLANKKTIAEYYGNVMDYIEDMINRISKADYSNAIRKDSSDVDACQKFTSIFNIDFERIIKYIDDDDCVLKCYSLIEETILSFSKQFNTFCALPKEFNIFLPNRMNSHCRCIEKCVNSENLLSAIKLRDKTLIEFDNSISNADIGENKHFTMRDAFRIFEQYEMKGNIYRIIYDNISDYYKNLKELMDNNQK